MDKLLEVLEAVGTKSTVPADREVGFTMISFARLGPDAAYEIRQLQRWMMSAYQLEMLVVGGGYGCTRIDMEICASDPDVAARLVLLMMSDVEFRTRAGALNFRIVILQKPYVRLDLLRDTVETSVGNGTSSLENLVTIDRSINVSGISNSNVAIGGAAVEQKLSVIREVDAELRSLLSAVSSDSNISKEQAMQIAAEISSLRAELEKPKPEKEVVRKNLAALGSISSIGSFVAKITMLLSGVTS